MIKQAIIFLLFFIFIPCQTFPDLREEKISFKPTKDSVELRPYTDDAQGLSRSSGRDNYALVDEQSAGDADSTYVYAIPPSTDYDFYEIPNPEIDGGIVSDVTIYYRVRETVDNTLDKARAVIKLNSTISYGAYKSLSTTYTLKSDTFSTKPGGGFWSWSDIDNLLIGVQLSSLEGGSNVWCTQVWAVVKYKLKSKYFLKNYDFKGDQLFYVHFYNYKLPLLNKVLAPFKGKPNTHYLEIGVFEGRTAIWMLENILTHPTSRFTGVDIFSRDFKERYLSNLKRSGVAHKATTIEGYSQVELRKLPLNSFDIIYIDACHRADCVLSDAVLSFELLKDGGILIFDDYNWEEQRFPVEKRPQTAIDSFITTYRNYIEVVHHGYQVVIKKRKNPSAYCESLKPFPHGCSPIGQYVYVWGRGRENELYPQDMSEPIKLSDEEKHLIERLLKSTKFGKTELHLECTLLEDKNFLQLNKRLKLDFTNIEIEGDRDDDGVCDLFDNCPDTPNLGQEDTYPPGGNNCGDACECEGDIDGNGDVDLFDLSKWKQYLGRKNCTQQNPCNGDFDCDGDVDDEDSLILKENIGRRDCAACDFSCSYE